MGFRRHYDGGMLVAEETREDEARDGIEEGILAVVKLDQVLIWTARMVVIMVAMVVIVVAMRLRGARWASRRHLGFFCVVDIWVTR